MHPLSKNTSSRLLGKPEPAVTTSNIKRARHWPVHRPFILMPVSDAICCMCVCVATRFAVNVEFEKPEIVVPLFSLSLSLSLSLIICFFFSLSKRKANRTRKKYDLFMCNLLMYIQHTIHESFNIYTCARVYSFKNIYIYIYILYVRR